MCNNLKLVNKNLKFWDLKVTGKLCVCMQNLFKNCWWVKITEKKKILKRIYDNLKFA